MINFKNVAKKTSLLIVGFTLFYANVSSADNTTQANTLNHKPTQEAKTPMQNEAFLAENKTKPGVVTLPDGLQYKVLVEGNGKQPKDSDTVTVNYAGTLIDGTEFDSSYKRGQPTSFPVNGVIPGWTEALKLMKVGSTWELYIPAALAYGAQGVPPVIGPNQTLIFKVELLSIQ